MWGASGWGAGAIGYLGEKQESKKKAAASAAAAGILGRPLNVTEADCPGYQIVPKAVCPGY